MASAGENGTTAGGQPLIPQPSTQPVDLQDMDRFLPIANVGRIMRRTVPDHCKIAKETKECVQECVSEFISFITSEASDRCLAEKRKTIIGDDIIFAFNMLGFDNYVDPMKTFLQKYRDLIKYDTGHTVYREAAGVGANHKQPHEASDFDPMVDMEHHEVTDDHHDDMYQM